MRIRIPRRFLLLAILLASLALVATSVATTPSYAKPIGWDDPNNPPPSKGDSDGGLQKSGSIAPLATRDSATGTSVTRTSWTTVRMYLLAMRLGYGWRWTW
jgi:hypothetical protein